MICRPPSPPPPLRTRSPPPPSKNKKSPCLCEGVAGQGPETPSHEHGSCPPLGFQPAFQPNIAGRRPAMFGWKAKKKKKVQRKIGAKIDLFSGRGGGSSDLKVAFTNASPLHSTHHMWEPTIIKHVLPAPLLETSIDIFEDVRFDPTLNFGHFGAFSLAFDLPQCQERWSIDFLVGGGARDHRKEEQEGTKHCSPCFLVKTSPAEGRGRFHKNTVYARSGVQGVQGGCSGCSGCSGSLTFWKGDQGGRPKKR